MQGCGQVSCGAWALLTAPLCPQRPTDEEGFLQPPGERSSENYQIVKGILERLNKMCGVGEQMRKKQQRLLKNMDAHKVMLDLLQIPYDKVTLDL